MINLRYREFLVLLNSAKGPFSFWYLGYLMTCNPAKFMAHYFTPEFRESAFLRAIDGVMVYGLGLANGINREWYRGLAMERAR